MKRLNFLKQPYYILIALDGFFGLLLAYYWLLRQVTTFGIFLKSGASDPFHLYFSIGFDSLSAVFFGLNAAISAYTWQNSRLTAKSGLLPAAGGIFGAAGAACPTCGAFLLSLIGAGSGLALLPFKGLEIKAISLAFFVGGFLLAARNIKNDCEDCFSPVSENGLLKEKELSGRDLKFPAALFVFFLFLSFQAAAFELRLGAPKADPETITDKRKLWNETAAKVLPEKGFETKINFGGALFPRLVETGAIDLEKFKALYESRGGLPAERLEILEKGSDKLITINSQNANFFVNIFWALGIANKNEILEKSPMITGKWSVFDFASTGGWSLGKEENGGVYYNKFELIELSPEQQKIAEYVAENSYRPCCGNSTAFPDCNHGAALLALIELGASQGLSKEELFGVGVKFNSFWFPRQYIETALYFKILKNIDWEGANPEEIMSEKYSSAGGWYQNVGGFIAQIPGLVPEEKNVSGCGA